jgi:hypothetical protein
MITDKIKALFQFIEYLHANIQNFKLYDEEINNLYLLDKERDNLNPRSNFADKLKYDEVQEEIKDKYNVIQEEIIFPIISKVTELNVGDLNNIDPFWNWNISEINNLKVTFSKDDIPEILKHKSKYLEFRTKTNCTYFQDFFFWDLDAILKELFDFFKEGHENEFEAFEPKVSQVNTISEVVEKLQKGYKKFSLPIDSLNIPKVEQQNKVETLPPPQIEPKAEQKAPETKKFPMYLLHNKRELLADKLKTEFSTERGKGIRLLIKALQTNQPQLINIENRQRTAIYNAMKQYFNRDIGTYQSIFDYKVGIHNDEPDFNAIKLKLDFVLKSVKNEQ